MGTRYPGRDWQRSGVRRQRCLPRPVKLALGFVCQAALTGRVSLSTLGAVQLESDHQSPGHRATDHPTWQLGIRVTGPGESLLGIATPAGYTSGPGRSRVPGGTGVPGTQWTA
eukprot:1551082-Rhodomonas_salina.1